MNPFSPPEVVHFLLCPKFDNLSWVVLVTFVEAVVILDVTTSMFELIECCLVYLNRTLRGHLLVLRTAQGNKKHNYNNKIILSHRSQKF